MDKDSHIKSGDYGYRGPRWELKIKGSVYDLKFMLKAKRNMQDKKSQYKGYLIVGLMITFLLVGDITYANAQGTSPATLSSIQHELKAIKSLSSLQLDFRLVGTIIAGDENSFAVIEEETTGKQGMYKLGESINEATVLKIDKDSIIVEKNGMAHILRITGGSYTEAAPSEILTENGSSSIGISEEFSAFEPVYSETGPPVDESVSVEELPHFEPITNNTGPSVDNEDSHEDLPEFESIVSYKWTPE